MVRNPHRRIRSRLVGMLAAALVLAAAPVWAEEPPDEAQPRAQATPLQAMPGIAPLSAAQAAKPRPRARQPIDPPLATEAAAGPFAAAPRPGYEPAPVPNRTLEAPRAAGETARLDQPSLSPSILYKNLPTPNQAAEGAPSHTEERLFAPGPGARLKLPFSY